MGIVLWTPERIEKLTELWDAGLSASKIAERMGGTTRNGVLGKVHRLHLSPRPARVKVHKNPPKPKKPRAARKSPKERPYYPMAANFTPHPVKPRGEAWEPLEGTTPLTLELLNAGQCKWPVGDTTGAQTLFCGARADAGSYCQHHHAWSIGQGTESERGAVKAAVRVGDLEMAA